MTTRVRKNKWVEDPFRSIYLSFANRSPASFWGSVAKLNKSYIREEDLFNKMMVWSYIERVYSIPASKDYSGSQAPYIRIMKLYDCFKDYCKKYRIDACSFKVFRDEIKQHLEVCSTKNGQPAVYLVTAPHPAFQHNRNDNSYDFDVFASPSVLDIWRLFGKKNPKEKYAKRINIIYNIRGGLEICVRKNYVLVKEDNI